MPITVIYFADWALIIVESFLLAHMQHKLAPCAGGCEAIQQDCCLFIVNAKGAACYVFDHIHRLLYCFTIAVVVHDLTVPASNFAKVLREPCTQLEIEITAGQIFDVALLNYNI